MKALSIQEPWATLIAKYGKTTENRTWKTNYRGPLLICASARVDMQKYTHNREEIPYQLFWNNMLRWMPEEIRGRIPESVTELGVKPGFAIATVNVIGCDDNMRTPWDEPGLWHWRLADAKLIEPFSVKGNLGLFDVEVDA